MAKSNSYNSGMRILKTLEFLRNLPEPEKGKTAVPIKLVELAHYLSDNGCGKIEPKTAKEILLAILDSDTGYCLELETNEKNEKGWDQFHFRRNFSLEQLSLLSSIIASSMFLNEEQIKGLLEQLKTLTSKNNATELATAEHFLRPRMMNENALNNLRIIHEAINKQHALRFLSCQMDINKHLYYDIPIRGTKKKVSRVTLTENGEITETIENPMPKRDPWIVCFPYALAWDNSRCYLIGGITDMGSVHMSTDVSVPISDKVNLWNFRVDRMMKLELYKKVQYRPPLSTPFYIPDSSGKQDTPISNLFLVERYMHSIFKMFTSSEPLTKVTLRFKKNLTRVIVEKFGFEVEIIPDDEEYALVEVEIQVSQQFYGWLAGFHAKDMQITAPQKVADDYVGYLHEIQEYYSSDSNSDT